MFQLPNEFYTDPDDMHYAEEAPCNWRLIVLLAVSALIVILAAVYVCHGIGLAALLPGIVDHQPRERRLFRPQRRTVWEWFDDNKDAVAGYTILAFVVLFSAGVLK